MRSRPRGRGAQQPRQAGLGGDRPAQLGALGRREPIGAGDHLGQAGQQAFPYGGVTLGRLRVVAEHEALALRDAHLLDAQVAGNLPIAASA